MRWTYGFNKNATSDYKRSFLFNFNNLLRNHVSYLVSTYFLKTNLNNPPANKASREVANLTERKNPNTPVYGVKEFVRLSVTKFDPNYCRTGKQSRLKFFLGRVWQKAMSQNFLFAVKWPAGPGLRAKTAKF